MKVTIIGAGVSGLAVGCYLQMNGFETAIYEQHTVAGGLCTSWQKDGFTMESGFQWLLGSGSGSPFYQLWSELIDMEKVAFGHHDIRITIEVRKNENCYGNKLFHLYTNLDRLCSYMLALAPEDTGAILKFIEAIRKIQKFEIPPAIKTNPEILPWYKKIGYARYLPMLLFLKCATKETNLTFASKLRNPFLKEAFQLLYDGDEKPLLIMTMPLAFNDLKGTGYPVGGAARFVDRIRHRYQELGGMIHFNKSVNRILTDGDRATGVQFENGEQITSDLIVSTIDWRFTFFTALEGKFTDRTMLDLRDLKKLSLFYSIFMVSLGVDGTYPDISHFFRFPFEPALISPDGTRYSIMEVHLYNYDASHAPEGKTLISVSFSTLNAAYWIDLRATDREAYKKQKEQFADAMIGILDQRLNGIKNRIEVVDVATPATFERYTKNRGGAVQGWMPGANMIERTPVTCKTKGLDRFYYSSHWSQPGGGLPVAIKSARDTAQVICLDMKQPFRVILPTGPA